MFRRCVTHSLLVLAAVSVSTGSARAAAVPAVMVDAYLRIQASLAGDTITTVAADARILSQQAVGLGAAGQKIATAAQALSAATDIKTARAAFGDLSDAMIAAVVDSPSGKEVRVAYCPMVKKSWLQKGSEIANPYFGAQMLRCGEFKK
jgi:Cu(I)/Ag(I) efflux system membrane fusion protein